MCKFSKGRMLAAALAASVVTAALVSCSAIARDIHPKVQMDFPKSDNITFTIVQGNDYLKISNVVNQELSKKGYSASITSDTGIINGIMGTFRQAVINAQINAMINGAQGGSASKERTGSSGTGFFVNDNGTVVTCAHVIIGAKKVAVDINGTRYDATVISINESTDLAIIKIDYASNSYFSLSEFEKENIGNKVSVLGYPLPGILGTEIRLTDGLISAKSGINSNPTYFQMSVPVQPGNSGGPIFNESFQVVGIASSKLSDIEMLRQSGTLPQNVNFGVKSEYAKLLGSQNFGNNNVLTSISDATKATVQVLADPDLLKEGNTHVSSESNNSPVSKIEIKIKYLFNRDAYHFTSTYMDIEFIDANTGDVVGRGVFIGDSYGDVKKIARVVLENMLKKM